MYNVEKFIGRCLDSCISQESVSLGSDYEIVCVDDGSPDNSKSKAEEYGAQHKGIVIVSQQNKGLSGARNTGLNNANGDYVWFVDSDDWIEENCLSRVIELCESHNLDILQFCAANIINNTPVRRFYRRNVGKVINGKECIQNKFSFCVPFSIYRREFLLDNNIRFYEGIYHEDNEFTPRVIYKAKRVEAIDNVLYYVYQNPNSITRTVNPKKAMDCFIVMNSLNEFLDQVDSECKQSFSNIITSIMNVALHDALCLKGNNKKEFAKVMKQNKHLFKHLKNSNSWAYKIEALLLKTFSSNPIEVYKILNYFDHREVKKHEV